MGGSSTTETVETAPLSPEGRKMEAAQLSLMLANLDDSGYSYNPKEVTEYTDSGKASQVQGRIDTGNARINEIQADIDANPYSAPPGSRGMDPRQAQLQRARGQVYSAEDELNGMEQTTYTDYQIEKMPDPRVQNAINQYGADSPEAAAMEEEIFQEDVFKSEQLSGIERKTLENVTKFVNGDLSYSDEQKTQVDTLYGGVKGAINTLKDDLFKQYGETDKDLRAGIGKVADEIDKTGFDVLDALKAAELQIDKSGANLFSVLQEVNQSTEAKFKFQQDLLFDQIDTQVNQQNAMLGLPPNSEAGQYQKAKMKQDTLTGMQLQLHEQELRGKMGIQSDMEGGKQKISLSRVALASAQGEKKEGIAKDLLSVTAATAQKKEGTLAATGEALLGLEAQKAAELKNLAYGNLPSMIGAGQGAQAFDKQMTGADQAINQGAMSPFTQQLGVEQARSMAETTTTTSKNNGFMDAFTGILGAGASGAGAVMGGMGSMGMSSAMQGMTNGSKYMSGGGGGGGGGFSNLSFGINPFSGR